MTADCTLRAPPSLGSAEDMIPARSAGPQGKAKDSAKRSFVAPLFVKACSWPEELCNGLLLNRKLPVALERSLRLTAARGRCRLEEWAQVRTCFDFSNLQWLLCLPPFLGLKPDSSMSMFFVRVARAMPHMRRPTDAGQAFSTSRTVNRLHHLSLRLYCLHFLSLMNGCHQSVAI